MLFDKDILHESAKELGSTLSARQIEQLRLFLQMLYIDITEQEHPHQVGYRIAVKDIEKHLIGERKEHGIPG